MNPVRNPTIGSEEEIGNELEAAAEESGLCFGRQIIQFRNRGRNNVRY